MGGFPSQMARNAELCPRYGLTMSLAVHTAHSRECRMNHALKLSGTTGYIASIETRDHGFGDASCPWVIEVNDGQRVNLTLFNFARGGQFSSGGRHSHGSQDICYEVAGIREPSGATKTVTLCDGSAREAPIYLSTGNKVTIQLESSRTLEELGTFVIKYEGRYYEVFVIYLPL